MGHEGWWHLGLGTLGCQGEAWHWPHARAGGMALAARQWPVPPGVPKPTVPRKQTDSRTPGPKPVAPGMWTATTWHRSMATERWHRGRSCHQGAATDGPPPRCCHQRDATSVPAPLSPVMPSMLPPMCHPGDGGTGCRFVTKGLPAPGATTPLSSTAVRVPCPTVPTAGPAHRLSRERLCHPVTASPCPHAGLSVTPGARGSAECPVRGWVSLQCPFSWGHSWGHP